jgi:hypothetical protein
MGIVGVALAVVAGVEEPDPGGELRGNVDDLLAVLEESLRERPAPLLPSTAQTRSDHFFA